MSRFASIAGLILLVAGNAQSAIINMGPNGCTLEDAIMSANFNASVGSCAAGSSTGIDQIIAPDDWVVTLTSDLPPIASDMTIRSASPAGLFYISGNTQRRVFRITGNNTHVTLRRVQVSRGKTNGSRGAGIRIENATVRIEDSIVANNEAINAIGAGIYVTGGDLTIDHSSVLFNNGHGISAEAASVQIVDSLVSHNSTIDGGVGLIASLSDLLIERSRFDEFRGISAGQANADIINSTFAYYDGESYIPSAFSFFAASVVTVNHVTTTLPFSVSSSQLRISNSFIASCELNGSPALLDTGNTSRMGSCLDNFGIGPTLLPLADNGGPTWTMAIADPNSEAINGGNPAYCQALDQRGEPRGARCDIGAYEATGFADVSVTTRVEPAPPYVNAQQIIVFNEITNLGPGTATNVQFDIDASSAFISSANSAYCNTIPCVITSIQPDQTLVIPVAMTLGSHFNSPFTITTSAHSTQGSTYTDQDEDSPSGNNSDDLTHVIHPGSDLSLSLVRLTDGPYFIGQTIQYQATIRNFGPQTATGIELQLYPTALGSVGFTGCTSTSGNTCNVASIGNGGSRNVDIQGVVTAGQFDAVASVGANEVDIATYNNVDRWNNGGGITTADISVSVALLNTGAIHSYEYISFEVTIAAAENAASNIQLDYDFPGAELIDIQGCATYPCIIPQLAANEAVVLLAQFFAPVANPGVVDTLSFGVQVMPGQQDTDLSNNEALISKALVPVADVAAQLSLVGMPPFYPGQEIEYALRVPNAGVNAATDVSINVSPQNLTLVAAFGDLCATVNCSISRLNEFDEENITLVYRINSVGAFNLTAAASASEFDSNTANNTDTTNNGGTALQPSLGAQVFRDGFE